MSFNTSRLRAPFFKVRIGPPNKNELVDLPPLVHRLIDSFEYHEIIDGSKASASRITLKFIEGSVKGLDVPGSVLDLQFNNTTGVRSLSESDVSKSKLAAKKLKEANEELVLLQAPNGPTKSGKKVDEQQIEDLKRNRNLILEEIKKNDPKFLLQERNTVEVTWGYRDPRSFIDLETRVARGNIQKITHRASGDSMPITEILITDAGSGEFAKQQPNTGVSFTVKYVKSKIPNQLSDYATNASDDAPARIDDIVKTIAKLIDNTEARIALTDKELELDLQDLKSGRNWATGTNLHDFLKGLAEKIYAHYYVTTNPLNKKTVINIVSRTKFEKIPSKQFVWKGGAGNAPSFYHTMKNYTLSLFPVGGEGAASSGVDSKKKILTGAVERKQAQVIGKGDLRLETMTSTDPQTSLNLNSSSQTAYGESSLRSDHVATAVAYAGRMDRGLRLDFTTVGIPSLAPSTIEVLNIGKRYSGLYYALSVTHKISADRGYVCDVLANTNAVASGGVTNQSTSAQVKAASVKIKILESELDQPGPIEPEDFAKIDGE